MPACPHTMKAEGRDGVIYCCDCGKIIKPKKPKAIVPYVDISHVTDADGVTRRLQSPVRVF